MIKGRYVAQVTIDFDVDETANKYMLPFDEMKDMVVGGCLTRHIEKVLTGPIASPERGITVSAIQQSAYLYQEDEE